MEDVGWDRAPVPTLGRPAAFAAGGLALAAAASTWTALSYAGRGAQDLTVTPGAVVRGEQQPPRAEYAGSFLVQAMLPLGIAVVLCAGAFLLWHSTLDRRTREYGGGLDLDRGQAIGGWFVPIANLILPLRALRELAIVYRSRLAEAAIWVWWIPWTVCLLLAAFGFNAAFAWSPFYDGEIDPTPEDLAALDKYGVLIGSGLALSAVAMLVVVLALTAAVNAVDPDDA